MKCEDAAAEGKILLFAGEHFHLIKSGVLRRKLCGVLKFFIFISRLLPLCLATSHWIFPQMQ
jgi:hypothetical protein